MKRSSYIVLIVFAVVLGVVWWIRQGETPAAPSTSEIVDTPPQQNQSTGPSAEEGLSENELAPDELRLRESVSNTHDGNCLNLTGLSEWDQHPLMIDEAERLAPILVVGPQAEAYRGQSTQELESLAAGGDSLAMAVLGAQELVSAFGDENSDSVEWLKHPGAEISRRMHARDEHTAKQVDALDRAAYWFQESALHGRLFALHGYAKAVSARFGGGLGLDWINEEQLRKFPSLSYKADPEYIYTALMFELEPNLSRGVIGAAVGNEFSLRKHGEEKEIIYGIIDEQKRLFLQDRDDRGLQAAQLPPSRYSDEEIRQTICQSGD